MKTKTATKTAIRVRFVIDQDAQFEECNGEARPLTEEEYAENAYQACPLHPRAGTKVIDIGGKGKPQIQGCAICGNTKYEDVPYAEYLAYYGNPDAHVYLRCETQKQCPTCGGWQATGISLWGIDFMQDSRELNSINVDEWMDEATAATLPGYAGEVAREQINETR